MDSSISLTLRSFDGEWVGRTEGLEGEGGEQIVGLPRPKASHKVCKEEASDEKSREGP